jgi:hypothetical protein
MIKKIDTHKIEHQPNIKIFVWNRDNSLENKPKQIMKSKINLMLKDKFKKEITQKTITEPKT